MEFDLKNTLQKLQFALADTSSRVNRKRLNVLRGSESCSVGCSGCCRKLVRITIGHAILIQGRLEKEGRWDTVRQECEKLVPVVRHASPVSWFRMNIPCPLLDNNRCSVYDLRPPSCSTHFVTSTPNLCDPWTSESGNYELARMDDIAHEMEAKIDQVFASHGILGYRLPIPTALLFAFRVRRVQHTTPEALHRIFMEEFR